MADGWERQFVSRARPVFAAAVASIVRRATVATAAAKDDEDPYNLTAAKNPDAGHWTAGASGARGGGGKPEKRGE